MHQPHRQVPVSDSATLRPGTGPVMAGLFSYPLPAARPGSRWRRWPGSARLSPTQRCSASGCVDVRTCSGERLSARIDCPGVSA